MSHDFDTKRPQDYDCDCLYIKVGKIPVYLFKRDDEGFWDMNINRIL